MAFTFVVEDGTQVAGANSYVTTAYADDYFIVDPNFYTTWTALTTTQKEYYLAWATRLLDQKVVWRGYRYTDTQALRWPRSGAVDVDGIAIAVDAIPRQLKEATCEWVKWLYTNDPTTGRDEDNLKRIVADVVEIEYQDDASQSAYPSIINQMLAPIGRMRMGGVGFAKIVR
ncbi:MAG: hypothetical protein IPO08_18575 [Xanthomonadales bacterium]|nr:hypothetical protein [Xanthomonadales bacterium]